MRKHSQWCTCTQIEVLSWRDANGLRTEMDQHIFSEYRYGAALAHMNGLKILGREFVVRTLVCGKDY